MGPRDHIRPDRSRPFRSVPAPVGDEDDVGVPDLLAKNPLKPPLTRRVKEIATLIGALAAIGGYVLGGGRWALKQADIAKGADITAAVAPLAESIKTSDAQRAAQYKALSDSVEAFKVEQRTALQEIKRTLRRMHAPKDLPQ